LFYEYLFSATTDTCFNLSFFVASPNTTHTDFSSAMKWTTQEYAAVLNELLPRFTESKKQKGGRTLVIEEAKTRINAIAQEKTQQVPDDLEKVNNYDLPLLNDHTAYLWLQKIQTWFNNNQTKKSADSLPEEIRDGRCATTWTVRKIVWVKRAKDITLAIQAKAPGCQPGEPQYLKLYPGTLLEIVKSLSQKEREEFENLVKEWNEKGVSDDLKAE
jgi:hypothetical protein